MKAFVLAAVLAFQSPDHGFFLEVPAPNPDPYSFAEWLVVDDETHSCAPANGLFHRRATDTRGVTIGTRDLNFYIYFAGGDYFWQRDFDREWTPAGRGSWLDAAWTKPVEGRDGQMLTHHLVWSSESISFVNDPRPLFSEYWYMRGPAYRCHVFKELRREHGPNGLQTVELDSGVRGIPAWTLETGSASIQTEEVVGNWLY